MGGVPGWHRTVALGLALGLAVALAGCSSESAGKPTEKYGVRLVEDGRLRVCGHPPYPPFQYQEDGRVVGFDVAILDLVAKKLGVRQKVVQTPYDELLSGKALDDRRCDAAAAALPITKEYEEVVDLSDSYFDAHQAMLVKADKPYRDLESLDGKKIGVESGTIGEKYVERRVKKLKLDIEVIPYEDLIAQQDALRAGKIAGAVNELALWSEYLKETQGQYEIGAEFDTGERYGIAVKQDNKKLLQVINDTLADAKRDGTYAKIHRRWLGRDPT